MLQRLKNNIAVAFWCVFAYSCYAYALLEEFIIEPIKPYYCKIVGHKLIFSGTFCERCCRPLK